MTEYKKVGKKKIEGKKQPVNVYKKAGSSKLYVMHKTAKSKFMSYVNYKKMYAKKVAAKKVVKRKVVVKKRKPTAKRGGQGCGYNMNGGYEKEFAYKLGGSLDDAITGIEYEKSAEDKILDEIPVDNKIQGEQEGGRKGRKGRKGGSGCGYHELSGGKKKRGIYKSIKKGGDSSDNDVLEDKNGFNDENLLLGGRRKFGGNLELNKLHEQLKEISMEGGRLRRSRSRRVSTRRIGGDLDELLGGRRKRQNNKKMGGDLDELLGGARRKRRRKSKRKGGEGLEELLGGARGRRRHRRIPIST